MKVAVAGLWHLGLVTAACLAAAGHDVIALADDPGEAHSLQEGRLPVHEPGLAALVSAGIAEGRLRFASDPAAIRGAQFLWITYDTPVDDDDRADPGFVMNRVRRLFGELAQGTMVLISSQLPVGSTRALRDDYATAFPGRNVSFACLPENLRLGAAIDVFTRPERVVAGADLAGDRERIAALLEPVTHGSPIEWMGVESAEMTKHALNAWLGLSVAFANEIAALCERVGADASEVARGVMTDARVGDRAYLRPGAAFAGGTLARDLRFLEERARAEGVALAIPPAAIASNAAHRQWTGTRLRDFLPDLRGRRIALLGLAYKPGTSTLRRSGAVDLARRLVGEGALVTAWDPLAGDLPDDLGAVARCATPLEALAGAEAAVIGGNWPELAGLTAGDVSAAMASPLVLDPARHLGPTLGRDSRIRLVSVGRTA